MSVLRFGAALGALWLTLWVAGCGQKGPLYLPKPSAQPPAATDAQQPRKP